MSEKFNNINKNLIPPSLQKVIELEEKLKRITIPQSIHTMIELQEKIAKIPKIDFPTIKIPQINFPVIDFPKFNFPEINFNFLKALEGISTLADRLRNNPELQFAFISDLEILNLKSATEFKESLISDLLDEDIHEIETILNDNLIPYLDKLGLTFIWLGANHALDSDSNPDKLRHCLISLRTILEYLIDEKLAPKNRLISSPEFKKEFKNYNAGKEELKNVRINRAKKIDFFTSKVQFRMIDFTRNEIDYICDCYTILCNIHNPDIGITENQVRSLKVKTGITIWLLSYIHEQIEN